MTETRWPRSIIAMRGFGGPAPRTSPVRLKVEQAARTWAPVARRVGSVLLAAWFAWLTYDRIAYFVGHGYPVGIDATIYHRGVVAWLNGGDPWAASVVANNWTYHYAGTPVTTVIMAPAALLSEWTFTVAWLVLTWGAAVWTLRRLRFPLWWLLFPPLAEALFSANPQLVVLALLVANRPLASAVATALKVYAFVPLLGERRWRQIAVAVAFNAATILVAPGLWLEYFRRFGEISRQLEYDSTLGGSAFYFPELLAVTVVALVILAMRDRRAAGWLAVPAVWPASQFHYSTMALPVMTPFLAALLAIPYLREDPTLRLTPVVIVLEIVRRVVQPWVVRRAAALMAPPAREHQSHHG